MTTQPKMQKRERVSQILAAALQVAQRVGYNALTREDVAQHAGIPKSLVSYHVGTMDQFRRDIIREALRIECLPVIAQGLALKDPRCRKAPKELKTRALKSLAR